MADTNNSEICKNSKNFLKYGNLNLNVMIISNNITTFMIYIYKDKLEDIVPSAISLLDEISFGITIIYTEMAIELKLFRSLHLHFIDLESFLKFVIIG